MGVFGRVALSDSKWEAVVPAEQVRLVNLLIERVQLLPDGIDIVWREVGWKALARELVPGTIGGEMLEQEGECA
ncbi:hypothetical protein CCP4SC76_4350003 [Gammaproteobacteria bacterium]